MNEFAATRVSPAPAAVAERVSAFLRAVYGWMCVGLGVTAVVASAITASPAVTQAIASNHMLFLGALFAELALVFYLSARVQRLTSNAATLLFLLYSGLNGVTLSVLLLAYTGASIATTFVVTAGMFGALAAFGSTTTRSLAGAGQFFFMGLVGLLLASILGLWLSYTQDLPTGPLVVCMYGLLLIVAGLLRKAGVGGAGSIGAAAREGAAD